MQFTIDNGTEYRLGFHHAPIKRQSPARFGAPAGITTCKIFRLGKDSQGRPKWHLSHVRSILQFGQYNYDKGRKAALEAALESAGWSRADRTRAWAAYHGRNSQYRAPAPAIVKAAA